MRSVESIIGEVLTEAAENKLMANIQAKRVKPVAQVLAEHGIVRKPDPETLRREAPGVPFPMEEDEMSKKQAYLTERERNIIRGKAIVGAATPKELVAVFRHFDELEYALDRADEEDALGTEGWRHFVGYPEED